MVVNQFILNAYFEFGNLNDLYNLLPVKGNDVPEVYLDNGHTRMFVEGQYGTLA